MPKKKVVDMRPEMVRERMVREIFVRRADGEMQKDIAKFFKLNEWEVSEILHRRRYADVTIGHDILVQVRDRYPKRTSRVRQKKGSTITIQQAISEYTITATNFVTAERQALSAGINQDTLDMIRVAIRENT